VKSEELELAEKSLKAKDDQIKILKADCNEEAAARQATVLERDDTLEELAAFRKKYDNDMQNQARNYQVLTVEFDKYKDRMEN